MFGGFYCFHLQGRPSYSYWTILNMGLMNISKNVANYLLTEKAAYPRRLLFSVDTDCHLVLLYLLTLLRTVNKWTY